MNVRERALAILNGKQPDNVPWFGDLSYWIEYLKISGNLPQKYLEDGVFQLYRDLGVGFYLQGYFPYTIKTQGVNIRNEFEDNGNLRTTYVETPVGSVREVWKYMPNSYTWGPVEHYVKDGRDLKVLRYWYEHITYEPSYQIATDRWKLVGDNGLVMCYLPRSPLMQMIAEFAGVEATTFAFMDYEDEFNKTMAVIREKADQAAQIALDSPAECLMIPENLSSEVVGKSMFKNYMESYEEHWNKKIKEAGKYSFVHMDGTMRGLISEAAATGFTVLEALTPAPVGDISIEEIHKWVEEDTIIWGGIPGVYFTDLVSDEEFDAFTIKVLEVMKTKPRYVLGVADQVPPNSRFERIARVTQLVEKYGKY